MKPWFFIFAAVLSWPWLVLTPALANEAQPVGDDPQIEARMTALAEDLRCLVCQNESLAGSHAELAEDLRREIRGLMHEGKNDTEVVDYLVARYGDFVLYRPPVKPLTWVLWFGPGAFLLIGAVVWWNVLRKRRTMPTPTVNAAQQAEVARLLESQSE